ncbi:hypothetical protein A5N82_07995 [Christensenella minuta]|uniref:Uncharacterized protein n=1 Tax=Christensenella minuta TaxID=626937 RepID=A0A136Q1N8_9FIRM|nr:hypothetical protein B1H56_00635 [Christensenella minuta]KXK64484.1 hypothetical protein HMPREF3293_02563 [Christensenella minuta]OAQ37157.1 hypothetical protein A5N82_07995 [Christensenella minuta]
MNLFSNSLTNFYYNKNQGRAQYCARPAFADISLWQTENAAAPRQERRRRRQGRTGPRPPRTDFRKPKQAA